MRKTAGIFAALAIAASASVAVPADAAVPTITTGGSSYSAAIFQACAANYTKAQVTYTASSSGTGRTNFVNKTFDFAGSDSAFGSSDAKPAGSYAYVPIVGGPIAILFNIAGDKVTVKNKGKKNETTTHTPVVIKSLNIDATTLGKIYRGDITKWNDDAIKALNPSISAVLPNATITPVYRGTKSGTNGNFSGYLKANGASVNADQTWSNVVPSLVGTAAADSATMVDDVESTSNSIGYADLKDANGSTAYIAALKNAHGQFLKPSAANSALFLNNFTSDAANGLVTIDWSADVAGGYNASLITYAVVATSADSSTGKGAAVQGFLNYMVKTCVPGTAKTYGYVPLPKSLVTAATNLIAKIK